MVIGRANLKLRHCACFCSCRWVTRQDKKELWLDGVEDYVKYAKKISTDFKDVLDGKSTNGAPPAAAGLFNFAAPQQNTSAAGAFSTSSGFGSGGFNFSAKPFAQTTTDAGAKGNAEEKEEDQQDGEDKEPSKVEIDTSKAEVLYNERLHLMTQDSETKKWKDRGTGAFTVRLSKPEEGSSGQVSYIVFTTDSGRVLINAPIVKGLKPMINPKSPANVIMMLISAQEDGSNKNEVHLFKCGSKETAKSVAEAVSKQSV